jgi:hypothetical protein
MILRPAQIHLMRMGRPVTPANFGGDSDSDSSTNTTNRTDNYAQNIDRRNVASDSAVSLSGDNNVVDRSSSSVTTFTDTSNRSTTSITEMMDKSNRSTNFADSSNRSTSTSTVNNTTVTDYGSINKSIDGLGSMTNKAIDVAAGGVNGAMDTLKYLASMQLKTVEAAFDISKATSANALGNSAAVMGFANDALNKTSDSMKDAKDSGQSKMVTYAIAAVAVVGVAFALKN